MVVVVGGGDDDDDDGGGGGGDDGDGHKLFHKSNGTTYGIFRNVKVCF